MANAVFTLTRDDLTPALRRMAKLGADSTPVMRSMGNALKSITEGNFNSVGSAMRPSPWPAKRDGSPSRLKKSGLLWHSFHVSVTRNSATVSNPTPYAAIHQFGGTIKGRPWLRFKIGAQWVTKHEVKIPARPFYPFKNGKLMPEAEEKILGAAERAIDRIIKGK